MKELRWNIDKDSIACPEAKEMYRKYNAAKAQMTLRTHHHELYGLIAKNKSIHEWFIKNGDNQYFSEGSTQYIIRKTLADTIQRVPDGELTTQYDKATKEHIITQYLFENKVMWSEFEGIDMMSNLTDSYKMAFIYAFAPVRTGFELDFDDDVRISYSLEQWSDVFINPDCTDIRRPQVVYFRQYLSRDDVEALIDEEGNVKDSTYHEDTIKYVLYHDMFSAKQSSSNALADNLKGATGINSLTLLTEYRRGADEFVTYVPGINAKFRTVPNYDPRKGIPWNFLVLETDKDFPIGVSQVEFLLSDQQFNDLFQTSAYKNLLLAMEPPVMVAGWETNPSSYKYEPRKIWNLGNNPNNVKVEPVKIGNEVLSNWTTTREAIAASMIRNLNVSDGTIAKDAGLNFSKTAPGVEEQAKQKTININQYQKRVETFISQWAAQALRMYINSMHGKHWLTVDEDTRRRLYDIGESDCIDGNKICVDFDELSPDMLEFKVRMGSLIERKEDQELEKLSQMVQPIIQNLNGWSDSNRQVIENEVLLPVVMRMVELSGTDISNSLADSLASQIAKNMMADMQQQIDQQQQQIDQQGQMLAQTQQALPPESQEQLAQVAELPVPEAEGMPAPAPQPMTPEEDTLPSQSSSGAEEETPGQQVNLYDDLLML